MSKVIRPALALLTGIAFAPLAHARDNNFFVNGLNNGLFKGSQTGSNNVGGIGFMTNGSGALVWQDGNTPAAENYLNLGPVKKGSGLYAHQATGATGIDQTEVKLLSGGSEGLIQQFGGAKATATTIIDNGVTGGSQLKVKAVAGTTDVEVGGPVRSSSVNVNEQGTTNTANFGDVKGGVVTVTQAPFNFGD